MMKTTNKGFLDNLSNSLNQFSVSLFSIFFVFLFVWLLLLGFSKYDGDELFRVFFYNPFVNAKRMKEILLVFAPFLVGAIAVWICFQLGLINLGVGGQMAGAALAVYFVAYFLKKQGAMSETSSSFGWIVLFFGVGIITAMLIAGFCGVLKVYFGVSEILSTIFTNYIIYFLFRYLITLEEIVNPVTKLSTNTELGKAINFNITFSLISIAFIFAIFILVMVWFVFNQTRFGLQIGLIGKSKAAATYSGLNINRRMVVVFLISGVLAGIAGIFYYYRNPGDTFLYKADALPGNAYDTITIVWLSQSSLIALPITSFFVALLRVQEKVIKISSVNPMVVEMMIGLIILSVAFFAKLFNDPIFYKKIQGWVFKITNFAFKDKKTLFPHQNKLTNQKTTTNHSSLSPKTVVKKTINYQQKGKNRE